MHYRRTILAARAAGVFCVCNGVTLLFGMLGEVLMHRSVLELLDGHPGALLGIAGSIAFAIWENLSGYTLSCALMVTIGVFLLRASAGRLWAVLLRLERS